MGPTVASNINELLPDWLAPAPYVHVAYCRVLFTIDTLPVTLSDPSIKTDPVADIALSPPDATIDSALL